MKFGIVSDKYKDPGFHVLKQVTEILENLGQEVVYPVSGDGSRDYHLPFSSGNWDGVDLALSLGGDGTFLYSCHEVYEKGIPLIGINLGNMGFMTEIEADEIEASLERLAKGDYTVKSRMMLEVKVYNGANEVLLHEFALNDIVLYRGAISRIIPCYFNLNGTKIETIPSDGIILAGPTGSTGYALACGGPIIHPQLDLMLLTPISPHTLHNRSYVIDPTSTVEIGIEKDYPFMPQISVDGRKQMEISPNERIVVRKAEKPMTLANLDNYEFFRRLPDKISARGRAR